MYNTINLCPQTTHVLKSLFAKDYQEAVNGAESLCKEKSPEGLLLLGYMYSHGLGVNLDWAAAEALFRQSLEYGLTLGCYYLGDLYEKKSEYALARRTFEEAVQAGDLPSCFRLATMHHRIGVAYYDGPATWEWARIGAERGNIFCRFRFAQLTLARVVPGGILKGAIMALNVSKDLVKIVCHNESYYTPFDPRILH